MRKYTCDHCDLFVFESDKVVEPNIMWCRTCIGQDYELIDLQHLIWGRDEPQYFWITQYAIDRLKTIPKLKNSILFEFLPPEAPIKEIVKEAMPCKRAYYGLENCTCGDCPPRRYVKNTNPFGY